MKIWQIVIISGIVLALVGMTGCGVFGNEQTAAPQTAQVTRGDLTVTVNGSGRLAVSRDAQLSFGVGGRVIQVAVQDGDAVSEGQVLAQLDTFPFELALTQAQGSLAQAQLAQSQAQLGKLQAQAGRAQALGNLAQAQLSLDAAKESLSTIEGVLPEGDKRVRDARLRFDSSQSQYDAARLQLDAADLQLDIVEVQIGNAEAQVKATEQGVAQAQQQLARATVRAPFNAIVAGVSVEEGDTVTAAAPAVYIVDLTTLELETDVDEIDIPGIQVGQQAVVTPDALTDLKLEGSVKSINLIPTVESGLVTYDVILSVAVPVGSNLRVGMSAKADIVVNEKKDILIIADRAIRHNSEGQTYVVKLLVGGTEDSAVVTGISDGFQTEIVSGLSEGDVVVIEAKTSQPGGILFGQ